MTKNEEAPPSKEKSSSGEGGQEGEGQGHGDGSVTTTNDNNNNNNNNNTAADTVSTTETGGSSISTATATATAASPSTSASAAGGTSTTTTTAAAAGSTTNGVAAQQPPQPAQQPSIAALNVYKKVAIIRGSDDVLTYEESDGVVKSINDLHLAAVATTPLQKPKPKDDIPVPTIKTVETYTQDIKPDYGIKTSYVRYNRPSDKLLTEHLEYVIDGEDEVWLRNNTKFGGAMVTLSSSVASRDDPNDEGGENDDAKPTSESEIGKSSPAEDAGEDGKTKSKPSTPAESKTKTTELPLDMMEIMIDVLEKATGFEMIVSLGEAQDIILNRLPQLYHMYPIRPPRNRTSVGGGGGDTTNTGPSSSSSGTGPVVTIRHVILDVHHYWMSKRSKLKRPLLRRFWPVTSTEDTNPHLVFRPREKEKYKLRKKRQNDMDAYRKLQQLKEDFSQIRLMLSMVRQREELNRSLVMLQKEWFEQKMYDAVDTSGLCRTSQRLDRESLDELMQVESNYDVQDTGGGTGGGRRKKQSRRGSGALGSRTASRSTSPVPESSSINFGLPPRGGGLDSSGNDGRTPMKIAGQNHGEPAPNFLHPLSTRESYTTSWEGSAPYVTTYVDSQPEAVARFRHRPRIGRGGRVVIDRLPIPTDPNFPPDTYYTAGHTPSMTQEGLQQRPKERLLDLLPQPLDHNELSRRIEDICLTALQEDYNSTYQASATPTGSVGGTAASTASLSGAAAAAGGGADVEENDGRAVVVSMKDWLDTDDQLWGKERYAIGPI